MTISALFATTSLVLVRAGWMRVVSAASCLVSATCLLFSLSSLPCSLPLLGLVCFRCG